MRRPSSHYVRRMRLRFRFAQVALNALALLAIGGGMAAYFKGTRHAAHLNVFNDSKETFLPCSLSCLRANN